MADFILNFVGLVPWKTKTPNCTFCVLLYVTVPLVTPWLKDASTDPSPKTTPILLSGTTELFTQVRAALLVCGSIVQEDKVGGSMTPPITQTGSEIASLLP